ncbi:MAG: flagellar M-ring protein FliF [Spirochaetaceae bacterium]|nr:flagellar M-ring protein FliF [Spirochaetaceae bacterium]
MGEWLKKMLAKAKELWGKWSGVQKGILIGIVVVVIGAIILVSNISTAPTTVQLFSTAITDAGARDRIVFRMDQEGVESTVSESGFISVKDSATARRMRSLLISEGLVPSNVDPWEVFDNLGEWSTTDYERDNAKQRAVEEQLRQQIQALDDVLYANVTVSFPERRVFTSEQEPVTASIIVEGKPNSDIAANRNKIKGIQNIVKFCVSGLSEENISIIDRATGNIINDFSGLESVDGITLEEKRRKEVEKKEAQLRVNVLNNLQGIFTSDRVRDINIKIEMDWSEKTESKVVYSAIELKADNPNTSYDDSEIVPYLPLSSETVDKTSKGTVYNPEGPTGVEGQNPSVYSDMSNTYTLTEEHGEKVNNAINTSHVEETKTPTIMRITASVNIDGTWAERIDEKGSVIRDPSGKIERDYTPVDASDLAAARQLVQDAIGYSRERGDSVTVTNIRVDRTAQFAEEDAALLKKEQTQRTIIYVGVGIIAVLIAFIVFRMISREIERKRRLKEEEILRKHQMEREKTLWEAEQAGMEVTMSVEERERAELQENAIAMAKEHPEDVAMLIKTWLMEE